LCDILLPEADILLPEADILTEGSGRVPGETSVVRKPFEMFVQFIQIQTKRDLTALDRTDKLVYMLVILL
jgi:hypothetical protein